MNLDKASLAKAQVSVISGLDASIPVTFDLSNLPVMGPLSGLNQVIRAKWDIPLLKPLAERGRRRGRETIPVTFDISKLPVMGPVSGLSEKVDTAAARCQSLPKLVRCQRWGTTAAKPSSTGP